VIDALPDTIPAPDPTKAKSIEQILAENANDAISKGANADEVTKRLGQMVEHLRANKELSEQANQALAAGADPGRVTGRIWQLSSTATTKPSTSAAPPEGVKTPSPRGASLAPIAQGATLGFADEILGLVNGANETLHGRSFQKGFQQGAEKTRAVGRSYEEEHPVASRALDVAGSMLPIVATGGASAEGGFGRAALQGAKYGAVGGAGTSEGGIADRAKGAAQGGALGAFLGPLLEGGAAVVKGGARALGIPELVSKVAQALADRLPAGLVQNTLETVSGTTGTKGVASKEITKRLISEGKTPGSVAGEVKARTAASGEKPEILADYSPEAASLTKAVTKEPGPGRAAVNRTLTARAAGTRQRLAADVGSAPSAPATQQLEALVRDREASGAKLFPKAYAAGAAGIDDPAINEILARPSFRRAYQMAQQMAADEGISLPTKDVIPPPPKGVNVDPAKWEAAVRQNGKVESVPVPDVRTIHYITRAVNRMIDQGFEGKAPIVDSQHAKVLQDALGDLRQRIGSQVPDFQTALDDYSARSGKIEALQTGRDILKYVGGVRTPKQATGAGDPLALKAARQGIDGLEAAVHNMKPDERALFRQGAQSAIQSAINKVPATVEGSTVTVLRRIFGNAPEGARWQRLLFDSPGEASRFQDALSRERGMAATKAKMGGSDTAENMNERESIVPSSNLATLVTHPIAAARTAATAAKTAQRQKVYGELGKKLAIDKPSELTELMAKLHAEHELRTGAKRGANALSTAVTSKFSKSPDLRTVLSELLGY
jgi:hypothetical protein